MARQGITGLTPKSRGRLRQAAAGFTAASIAAAKAAWDQRQRRKKNDAARQAHLARITKRKSAIQARVRQGPQARITQVKLVVAKPAPPTPRPAPITRTTTTTSTVGGAMSARQLLAISEDFLAVAARDRPDGMLDVVLDAHLMPQVMANLAAALKIRYDRALEHPLHQAIKDMYASVHTGQIAVITASEEIGPAIESIHKDELERLRNPRMRGDESMWDVTKNRGAA